MTSVTFDSCTWERIFDDEWHSDRLSSQFGVIRGALKSGAIKGFICGTTFQLESIARIRRAKHIAQSRVDVRLVGIEKLDDGSFVTKFSIGPNDDLHPGLHPKQLTKLKIAIEHGVRLIDGNAWMWLPNPIEQVPRSWFVPLSQLDRSRKDERQIEAFYFLSGRGVGKAKFDDIVEQIERANGLEVGRCGWEALHLATEAEAKRIAPAVAEWCDAEIIAAHHGYGFDLLCTLDQANRSRNSAFNREHVAALHTKFGLVICSTDELLKRCILQ